MKKTVLFISFFGLCSFLFLLFMYRQPSEIYGAVVRTAGAEYFLPKRQFSCEGSIETSLDCQVNFAGGTQAVAIEFGDQYPFATSCRSGDELCTVKHLYYYRTGQTMRPYIELDSAELELSLVQKISMGTQSLFIGLLLGIESIWISFLAVVFTAGLFVILWRGVIEYKHQPSFRTTIGKISFHIFLWLFGMFAICLFLVIGGVILD